MKTFHKLLSFCLSFLILVQTIPAAAIANLGTPIEQASQVPSSIFDGLTRNKRAPRSVSFFASSYQPQECKDHPENCQTRTKSEWDYDDYLRQKHVHDYWEGENRKCEAGDKPGCAGPEPRIEHHFKETITDWKVNQNPSSQPTETDPIYNTGNQDQREPDHAVVGFLTMATAIAAMIGLATGAPWAGILLNISLGAVAGVVAVGLLATNPSKGAFSGIIDSFSFGSNPAKELSKDKDNPEEPLNPFYEATYYLAKTTLLLASLAFAPLALTGGISVSLPVLIAGSALSGLNILSTAVGLISKDSANQESSVKAIPSPESLSLEGRGQGEGDKLIQFKASPEQLQSQRTQALTNKQENHIAFESLSPTISPEDKARKYPDDDRAWEHIKTEGKPVVQKLFTIRTNPDRPSPVTTRGFNADNNTHDGIDIDAPKGSVVTSEQEATVLYARYHKNNNQHYLDDGVTEGLGNAVILYPPNTTRLVVYQHFGNKAVSYDEKGKAERGGGYIAGTDKEGSGLLVQEGETIKPGTPIGTIGNTGSVTSKSDKGSNREGTHLHVSVVELDPAINPNMRKLEEMTGEIEVVKNDKKVKMNPKDFADEIRVAFRNGLNKNGDKRAEAIRQFLFNPNYKPYIYMNPIEAQWFYKESGSGQ